MASALMMMLFLVKQMLTCASWRACSGNHVLPSATPGTDALRTKNSVARHIAYMEEEFVCPYAAAHADDCRMWWVTTHQRLNHRPHVHPRFGSEDHATIRRC